MHLCVGGFFSLDRSEQAGAISGANGDMGENNTAGLDPIFFFHHCFIDRLFWLWQVRHGMEKKLEIIPDFAGTSSSDMQGPTPDLQPGSALTLQTPLAPWKKDNGSSYTSEDVIDIASLGYSYSRGSLEESVSRELTLAPAKCLCVSGINRALFEGSFIIHAFAHIKDAGENASEVASDKACNTDLVAADATEEEPRGVREIYLGCHAVLSRFNVRKCANCLTHLEVCARFPLEDLSEEELGCAAFCIVLQHRGGHLPSGLEYTCTVDGELVKTSRTLGNPQTQHSVEGLDCLVHPQCPGVQKQQTQQQQQQQKMQQQQQQQEQQQQQPLDLDPSPLFGTLRDREECCTIA
jgi:tyrosinase